MEKDFIVATALALGGVLLGWLGYRQHMRTTRRNVELQLWKEGGKIVEGRVILRNDSNLESTIDRIEVIHPKGSKVASFASKQSRSLSGSSTLDDPGISNIHSVNLTVSPGKSAGISMAIGLPSDARLVDAITLRCRLHPADRILGVLPRQWRTVSLPLSLAH